MGASVLRLGKHVAGAAHGDDASRLFRIVLDGRPYPGNMHVDGPVERLQGLSFEKVHQGIARHHASRVLGQGQKKGKLIDLENRRTLYDSAALSLALLPLLMWPMTAITAPAATTSGVRHFDGVWVVDVACKGSAALGEVKRRILATISNGVFRGQQGPPRSPGGITLEGTIEADGAMRAFAEGNVTQPPSAKFSYTMMGRLEGTSGTATRDDRDCDVKFAKQQFPIAAPASARH